MRASWTGTGDIGTERVVGALVIAADLALWAFIIPSRTLAEILPI